jgi:hypothetical protein
MRLISIVQLDVSLRKDGFYCYYMPIAPDKHDTDICIYSNGLTSDDSVLATTHFCQFGSTKMLVFRCLDDGGNILSLL